ncbi:uncharacterized protein N7469_003582 [Penicillium citrinum]|uniref:Sidoreflexin n=2 Tax=Penicillium TaxID=5073 RepID=A0A9W9TRH8_PENCI|nr:uncharacterized protein N7469_003582 [Penicillium citrinum]KAJ5234414.1 hypothetical protein N7469_003582 [Penicillium citrinum]KAJ5590034.1 hypothetical protein N7450_004006 [Penicillium hetheringtonii]
MASSLSGSRQLPDSRYDLSSYWGRVRQCADLADPRTLFTSASQLNNSINLLTNYKHGKIQEMNPELWQAKKIVDSTLHPDTGNPVLLPFRMSCYVFSNLVVTAGMLIPGMKASKSWKGILGWQIANQSLNVAINSANANQSAPLSTETMIKSYFMAVSASCTVALGLTHMVPRISFVTQQTKTILKRLVPFAAVASAGALNVFLMRGEEIRRGIDVFPVISSTEHDGQGKMEISEKSLGKSSKAAFLAVGETATSRVINAIPVMVVPSLLLLRFQKTEWLKKRPSLLMPVNIGLVFLTSTIALPFALAIFPQRQVIRKGSLEEKFSGDGRKDELVAFNRGI